MQDSLKEKSELVYVQNTIEADFAIIPLIESKNNTSILFEKKPIGVSDLTFHPPV